MGLDALYYSLHIGPVGAEAVGDDAWFFVGSLLNEHGQPGTTRT